MMTSGGSQNPTPSLARNLRVISCLALEQQCCEIFQHEQYDESAALNDKWIETGDERLVAK